MKKKILSLVIALLLFIPVFVKADMGAPMLSGYDAIINNSDGATYYDMDWEDDKRVLKKVGTLDYDTEIHVISEDTFNGKIYYQYTINNQGYYYVLGENVLSKDFDIKAWKESESTSKSKNTYYVIGKNTYLFNGPAFAFGKNEKVGEIPVGTELKSEYHDEMFAYVEYKGNKGFVYTFTYLEFFNPYIGKVTPVAMVTDYENLDYSLYALNDLKLENYDSKLKAIEADDDSLIKYTGTIPAKSNFKMKYTANLTPHETYAYIEYKDISGWYNINNGNVVYQVKDLYGKADISLQMYSEPSEKGSKIEKIGANKVFKVVYYDLGEAGFGVTSLYVEYNGKKGWIFINFMDYDYDKQPEFNYCDKDGKVLDEFNIGNFINDEEPSVSSTTTSEEEPDTIIIKDVKKFFSLNLVVVLVSVATLLLVLVLVVIIIILVIKNSKKNKVIKKQKATIEGTEKKIEEVEENKEAK